MTRISPSVVNERCSPSSFTVTTPSAVFFCIYSLKTTIYSFWVEYVEYIILCSSDLTFPTTKFKRLPLLFPPSSSFWIRVLFSRHYWCFGKLSQRLTCKPLVRCHGYPSVPELSVEISQEEQHPPKKKSKKNPNALMEQNNIYYNKTCRT